MVNHEGREDAELCAEIAKLSPCALVQIEEPLAVKAFIGGAELVISSRFHGAVNALSQGVPCIATSWSHKYHAMMSDFGMADYCVQELTAESLCLSIDLLLANKADILPQLADNAAQLKQRNKQMWQQLWQHLLPTQQR